jgi:hypothetical protein
LRGLHIAGQIGHKSSYLAVQVHGEAALGASTEEIFTGVARLVGRHIKKGIDAMRSKECAVDTHQPAVAYAVIAPSLRRHCAVIAPSLRFQRR